jgi:hypothetical protein
MLFDNSSFEPRVLINGKERYVTRVGGAMTILGVITCIALAGYFIVDFFERNNINVIYSKESNNVLPVNNLIDKFFVFHITDVSSETGSIDERVVKIVPVLIEFKGGQRVGSDILDTKPCTNTTFQQNYTEIFNQTIADFSSFNCIDSSKYNLTLFNDINNGAGRYLNIYIARCIGTTLDGRPCLPEDEVNETLNQMRIYYEAYYLTHTYDHGNLDSPLIVKPIFDYFYMGMDIFRTKMVNFRSIIYESDSALIFTDPKSKEGIVFDDVYSYTEYSGINTKSFIKGTFSVVQYNLNGDTADVYRRTYPKLQQLLANIMGVVDVILVVCNIISQYISYQMMIIDLSNIVIRHVDLDKNQIGNLYKSKKVGIKSTEKPKSSTDLNSFKAQEAGRPKSSTELNTFKATDMVPYPRDFKKPIVKRMSTTEAILCAFCTRINSAKRLLDPTELILRRQMSVDYFLRFHSEFERLKRIMLNDVQYRNFDQLPKATIEEHMKTMTIHIKELYVDGGKDNNLIPALRGNDEVTLRMMKLIK